MSIWPNSTSQPSVDINFYFMSGINWKLSIQAGFIGLAIGLVFMALAIYYKYLKIKATYASVDQNTVENEVL